MNHVTFVVETIEYHNDTKMTQVFYDAEGDPVYILPGETKKYTKKRRALPEEVIFVEKEKNVTHKSNVKGQSKSKSGESKVKQTGGTSRRFNRK